MFDELREYLVKFIKSRMTVLLIVFLAMGGILCYRCFDLQIVHGEEYLDDFILTIEKTRDLSSTRGIIYDRNGYVLAYNDLAYSVKIEDVFEAGRGRNRNINQVIYQLIGMVERCGDRVISDFDIVLDEDGNFAFNVEGTARLRFLADIYGYVYVDDMKEEEKLSTALDVMKFLSRNKGTGFAVGDYAEAGNSDTDFVPGKGYTDEEWLKMVTIRYAMSLTAYRKYIGTTVATNVNERTVAVILENSDILEGVSIEEVTVRRYVDSRYFSHLLGYTGKISSAGMEELNAEVAAAGGNPDTYSINDVVGKSGIERYMETTLQGTKGSEKVVVDTTGKVMEILERREPKPGNDVYLTIDRDLTVACYSMVEQKLAGMIAAKLQNIKEYPISDNTDTSKIPVCIYDVYYAMFNNNIVDTGHFLTRDAGPTEREVLALHDDYKQGVYGRLLQELTVTQTPYNKLPKEYQVYQSNIVTLLRNNDIILRDLVDPRDATQIAWAEDEVISLGEYLRYCISKNWINVSLLALDTSYSDSEEVYSSLLDEIIELMEGNAEFQKRFYKYMLLNDVMSGAQVCKVVCEQRAMEVSPEDEDALYNGKLTAYQFMKNRITNLDVTPAQLALDPCNASVVVTDVNTGDVLALVTYPGYDNNMMANSINAAYYAKLHADKSSPLYNFATQNKAAPGSTFKMVSAAAGYMEGVIDLGEKVHCTGTFTSLTQQSPRCWKRLGHGDETMVSAIRDSCNFYFYEVGFRLASSTEDGAYDSEYGLELLAKYADLFGLTDKSGIEITEETPNVSDLDPVRSAIGQGTHSYTTVGLARYVTTVANSGTCYNLTLLDRVTDTEGEVIQEYDASIRNTVNLPTEYWTAVHSGMRQMVENKVYFDGLAVHVAGKTGTAQQSTSRPSHALFVSYAPVENPEISVTVRIPFGYSSDYAATLACNIYMYYYGLAEEDELVTGTADKPDIGISNEM